ncbi:extracellular solute-binding protein [Proteiniborus sp. MB09-C3]|uniref:extracellular solute-binding protein n=1 Tax=Proteiniborus sp. MB09-C3 TaxID=3050072 RepID=UPI002555F17C|nr:extracellular solute-binding protein [Proteiniborus sp. MB09-C3]WIV11643.1 extracellular solute-binding protein [Proteiniborus sp. MB09-C3]
MKGKKVLILIFITMLILSSMVGCKKEDKQISAENDPNEKITIKYWVPFSPNQYIQSLNESEMYKELEKRTGVHVDFIHPTEGEESEKFNLLLNSKELPDVIQTYAGDYKGGMDKAIEDGVYLRLNELIDKYAPNFKKLREEDPELARQTMTDGGNIYAFPVIGIDPNEPAWWGPVFRGDWLEDLGLEIPTTIDEWHNVLTQFKLKKNAKAPLVISTRGIDPYGTIISAWDIGPGFYKKDNVIKYAPMQPEFKEYLTTMNKWYNEGLLDKDFTTRDSKARANLITSGETGIYITEYALVDQYQAAIKSTDPKAKFVAGVQPSLKPGQKVNYRVVNNRNGGYEAVITTSAKNPAAIVKWFDYAYSQDGFMLFNYGIEGVSYNMVDGKPQFTELLTNNPDGLDFWSVSNKYKLEVGPYLRDYTATPGFTDIDYDCMEQWTKAGTDLVIPPVNFTPEDDEMYSNVMTDIATYKDEMVLKFIVGEEPLSEFDNFVAQLKKMDIDKAIKIYQDALDRYNSR